MTTSNTVTSTSALQQQITGRVLLPTDPDYDQHRRGFNLAIDQHPALILISNTTQDVVAGIRFANMISVSQSSSPVMVSNILLIVTSHMKSVQVNAEAQTVEVEAGVHFKGVLDQVVKYGLAPLMGTSPHIGVIGYTLGGGIGWLGRKYGFAADSVRWMDVVTADGELRRASPTENVDLFWGLRGGGVTSA